MEDFNKAINDIINHLNSLEYKSGDLSDISNEVGYILGGYINNEPGFDYQSIMAGIQHGIDLSTKRQITLFSVDSEGNKEDIFTKIINISNDLRYLITIDDKEYYLTEKDCYKTK